MMKITSRDMQLATDGTVVGFYEREFYPFSNFSSFQVQWRGKTWMTSEHAYQAAHFFETSPELAEHIYTLPSAHEAYKLAKANTDRLPTDWDVRKIPVMKDILRAKLSQHVYVREKLLQTGEAHMVEDSPKDSFWGWGANRQGRNELGKIWMQLREELQNGEL